jgi:hypothetical protein
MEPIQLAPTLENIVAVVKQNARFFLFKRYCSCFYDHEDMKQRGAVLFENPMSWYLDLAKRMLDTEGLKTLQTRYLKHCLYAVETLHPKIVLFDPHFIPVNAQTHHDFINTLHRLSPTSALIGIEESEGTRQVTRDMYEQVGMCYHTGTLHPALPIALTVPADQSISPQLIHLLEPILYPTV